GNRGFTGQQEIPVGGNRPTRVATGDLDGDGADDIVVLNSGGIPNDLITVLLNSGTGHFKTQKSYRVGLRGMDIAIADVNNDGARDILVLNGKDISGRAASFTVAVYLNILNTDVDPPVATGLFQAQPNILINCPQDLSGIGAFCDPAFITTGDFDANGSIDFAVSYEVFATSGAISLTAGYVAAYAGEGDGTFSPAARVAVGERPMGVATGDFNKDAIPDIAVAEEGQQSVRLVYAVPPNQRSTGSPCTAGGECLSMYCVDGLCCESPACPAGQSCRVPGQTGHCSAVLANGLPCTADAQCGSNSCIEGVCC